MLIREWWRGRKDSPAYWWQLRAFKKNVRLSCETGSPPDPDLMMEGSLPDPGETSPILLAGGDEIYFYRYGRQLAISMRRNCPSIRTHIHIYEPSPLCIADAEVLKTRLGGQLTISYESHRRNPYVGAPSGFFFAAGRFAVASFLIERNRVPVMVIDIDGIVKRDLADGFAALRSFDVGVVRRKSKPVPWRKILACAVYLNTTDRARLFAAQLATALRLSLSNTPKYHVDQTTIHYLLSYYESHNIGLSLTDLSLEWCDSKGREDSFIWTAKGMGKVEGLLNIGDARAIVVDH